MRKTDYTALTRSEVCPRCGGEMYVSRRSPHPFIIWGEKQILTCCKCEAQSLRSVGDDGTVIA